MKKKFITFLSILAVSSTFTFAAPSTVKVVVNNKTLSTDTPAVIRDSRTMVPFRALFESLGAKDISWDEPTQSVTGSDGITTVKLVIGSYDITVNGNILTMDTPPVIINSRTMIPLSAVSKAMGGNVSWDGKNYIASVTKNVQISNADVNNSVTPIFQNTPTENQNNIPAETTTPQNNTSDTFNNIPTSNINNNAIVGYYAMQDLKRNKFVLNLKSDGKAELISVTSSEKNSGTYSYKNNKLTLNIASFNSTYTREDVVYEGSTLTLMKDDKNPKGASTFVVLKTTQEEYNKYIKEKE